VPRPTDRPESPGSRPIRVLEAFPAPGAHVNPYTFQLFDAFPEDVEAEYFTWKRALVGDFDVFHIHWPEVKVRGATAIRSLVRGSLFLLVLVRVRLTRRALVRTLHDLRPHEAPNRLQQWVLDLCDRWTTLWIVLNRSTPVPGGAPSVLIRHGHYREWFDLSTPVPTVPGRLLNFGLVRRYKGVDRLVRAFRQLPGEDLSLHVVGEVQDAATGKELADAAGADRRITVADAWADEDLLTREIRESELVVLPFRRITNSGSLLLALSLDRPVLAPAVGPIGEVADEVGPGWVQLFDGELDVDTLASALAAVRDVPRSVRPDLSRRDWLPIGRQHAEAFREACVLVGRRARVRDRPPPT
jgi:beta-1,4-mannosyltransferase